ncbi:ATP synthase subunit I [Flocculibacter collagenilyticus]|uniref:ATP synthase subunit I n=1 Tax=Flocculibacter collagenilyticus TaxID=2744479 RepID=UPI0018F511D5|nr:ATP synthase subunit I [Flocculibacter collagenilyticus]
MAEQIAKPRRQQAFKWVAFQGLIVIILSLISYIGWGSQYASSTFFGGAVVVIPNFVFTVYAFRFAGARQAKQIVASMSRGVSLKLFLTAVLSVLALKGGQLNSAAFFVAFFIVLMTQWLLPVFFKQQKLG